VQVGKPAPTPVMQAGTARHEQLEREVITRVEVPVTTREDAWALKLLNMITGLRQLLHEGMTRELYM
jgi:exonuclease V